MARNWFNRPLPLPNIPRAMFDLHEDRLQTMRMARLCPIGIQECIPKDIHMFSHDSFLRLAPLKYPILQKLNLNLASFFVPDRLVLGEEKSADLHKALEPSEKLIPKVSISGSTYINRLFGPNSILDYLGVQADLQDGVSSFTIPNPIPLFSWLLMLKDYFIDENLEADLIEDIQEILDAYMDVPLGGTLQLTAEVDPTLLENFVSLLEGGFHVSKYRDYFVAGLPSPQRGDDVYIMNPAIAIDSDGNKSPIVSYGSGWPKSPVFGPTGQSAPFTAGEAIGFDTTIRDLLTKMAYQSFKNTLNQFGTRYNEFLAGNYGVINQDVRLQRAECIGRSKGVFQISEVIQQSATESDSPLGSYAGKGIGAKRTRNFRYHVNEHGFLFHMVSVVPDQGYMSGAPRWFFKESGLDFALPKFNNIGEQAIYKGELFLDMVDPELNKTDFAYIPRYSEYRSGRNYASAGMRQSPFTAWHLYEQFGKDVALNSEFIKANDSDRIFNLVDPTSVQNIVGVFHSYHAAFRPISNNPK